MYRCWSLPERSAEKPFAEYAQRNAAAILEVLRKEFGDYRAVLEIGSGTGQHAICFAAELPHLEWQTSDLDSNHAGIRAWIDEAGLANVRYPISLDVRTADLAAQSFDAAFSSNTAHIMSADAVTDMFALVSKALRPGGAFCLYGPFRRNGTFNTESNARFDAELRSRDSEMGIRDLESLDGLAQAGELRRASVYAVPANNLVVLWKKS